MKKYKVNYTLTQTGYVFVFADNEDHAITKLHKEHPMGDMHNIEYEDYEFVSPLEIEN